MIKVRNGTVTGCRLSARLHNNVDLCFPPRDHKLSSSILCNAYSYKGKPGGLVAVATRVVLDQPSHNPVVPIRVLNSYAIFRSDLGKSDHRLSYGIRQDRLPGRKTAVDQSGVTRSTSAYRQSHTASLVHESNSYSARREYTFATSGQIG